MNHFENYSQSSDDEFEDVPSPFASSSASRSNSRKSTLSSRWRKSSKLPPESPIGTFSSEPPLYPAESLSNAAVEEDSQESTAHTSHATLRSGARTTRRRRYPSAGDSAEFINMKTPVSLKSPRIEYLDNNSVSTDDEDVDEEENFENERLPVVPRLPRVSKKKSPSVQLSLWQKLGWITVGLLSLRLIFMDRGVWDYYRMDQKLKAYQSEIDLIKKENTDIQGEIQKIGTDKAYQKFLAKEHLGVIAADEHMILFPEESP